MSVKVSLAWAQLNLETWRHQQGVVHAKADAHLGTGVVLTETLEGDEPVVALAKELGGGGRVGEEVPDDRRDEESESTHKNEDA
jgi:hypothetical protein